VLRAERCDDGSRHAVASEWSSAVWRVQGGRHLARRMDGAMLHASCFLLLASCFPRLSWIILSLYRGLLVLRVLLVAVHLSYHWRPCVCCNDRTPKVLYSVAGAPGSTIRAVTPRATSCKHSLRSWPPPPRYCSRTLGLQALVAQQREEGARWRTSLVMWPHPTKRCASPRLTVHRPLRLRWPDGWT
jgi:hypothetical protein